MLKAEVNLRLLSSRMQLPAPKRQNPPDWVQRARNRDGNPSDAALASTAWPAGADQTWL